MIEPIGKRLRRLRLARGLSQRDLSSPGVSYAYISRIEAGARTPSIKALRHLAAKLRVSVEYLETGFEDEIEQALAVCGLTLADFTLEEFALIERAASAWRRIGAFEATLRVLEQRDLNLLEALAGTMENVRERLQRGGVNGREPSEAPAT